MYFNSQLQQQQKKKHQKYSINMESLNLQVDGPITLTGRAYIRRCL